MQSALIDIGLERDAFLYVSDFMELGDSDDVDEIPASDVTQQRSPRPPQRMEAQPVLREKLSQSEAQPELVSGEEHAPSSQPRESLVRQIG